MSCGTEFESALNLISYKSKKKEIKRKKREKGRAEVAHEEPQERRTTKGPCRAVEGREFERSMNPKARGRICVSPCRERACMRAVEARRREGGAVRVFNSAVSNLSHISRRGAT